MCFFSFPIILMCLYTSDLSTSVSAVARALDIKATILASSKLISLRIRDGRLLKSQLCCLQYVCTSRSSLYVVESLLNASYLECPAKTYNIQSDPLRSNAGLNISHLNSHLLTASTIPWALYSL